MAATSSARQARSGRGTSPSSGGRRSGRAEPLVGKQTPWLYTPPLRELTPDTSLGFEVIEFWDWMRDRLEELDANRAPDDDTDYLGLLPRRLEWQSWLLIHALELLDAPGCVFRFRTVLLLVARQNGKSTLLTVLILWRLFQDGARMVLETHASLDHARLAWEEAVAVAEAIPELADEIAKKNEGKGSELVRLDGGETFKIAAANRRGGRGFRGDLILFDELREHQDWRAWSATSKTTMARRRAQVWGVSNAGDAASVVLRHLRDVAIAAITGKALEGVPEDLVGSMDLDSIGLFEWSAGTKDGDPYGPLRDIWDREGWAQANPSLGLTELDERAIAAAVVSDPEFEVRTEVLCQFVNTAGSGPFPSGSWAATAVPTVTRDRDRPFTYGLAMSHKRDWVHVAVAFWDTEGRVRVEIAARRPGPEWLIPWLKSDPRYGKRAVPPEHVTMQTKGAPISGLREDLEAAGIDITPWEGVDLAGWHGKFYDLLRAATADDSDEDEPLPFTHAIDAQLDVAAATAVIKPLGDGWALDLKKSPEDAAPLQAAIGAVGLLLTNPVQMESAYEERGLLVV